MTAFDREYLLIIIEAGSPSLERCIPLSEMLYALCA